ncbi:MAG: ABC transporter ATP-binding protein, partial [Oscillospiraceae bacterium]|nr:ABC transporter ATP-binding protein [Oscillospiraceae bacterium]
MKETHAFRTENVVSGYDGRAIVRNVGLTIPERKISIIIGANACGKTTLLKTMARLIKPMSGSVTLDGKEIGAYSPKKLARIVGLLPQSPIIPEGIAVSDLVGRGRFPHQKMLKGWTKADYEAVAEAMETMHVAELANRSISELSGGQRQRVWIAMALAQQTDILLLDEPTTFLDIAYQVEILEMLHELNQTKGITIVMVLHDINLSARYAQHIFAMKDGRLIAQGSPREVITTENIRNIFGLDSVVIQDPVSHS